MFSSKIMRQGFKLEFSWHHGEVLTTEHHASKSVLLQRNRGMYIYLYLLKTTGSRKKASMGKNTPMSTNQF